MGDTQQTNLKEPDQVDWDKVGGSNYQAPPPAEDATGKAVVYFGQLPSTIETDAVNDDGYREYVLDPIKLTKNGNGVDGYVIRFSRVTLKPWKNGGNSA